MPRVARATNVRRNVVTVVRQLRQQPFVQHASASVTVGGGGVPESPAGPWGVHRPNRPRSSPLSTQSNEASRGVYGGNIGGG